MAGEEVQTGAPAPEPARDAPVQGLESRLDTATAATPSPEPGGAAGVQAAGQTAPAAGSTTQPPAPAEWQSIRDYAREQGYELPWESDHQALNHLIQGYRQLQERNYYAELGQRMTPYAEQFQQFLQQQQQPQAPVQQAWQPPPFKREWLQMVETDPETGVLRSKPGYDPKLPEKVQAYADWRDKFLQEPESVIAPLVEERARAIARQEQATFQEQATAQDLIRREAPWMFEGGVPGARLTAPGQMYGRAAQHFWNNGLTHIPTLHAAAVALVQNALFRQQAVASRQAASAAGAPAPSLAAEVPVSVAGRAPGLGVPRPATPTKNGPPPSLRERLMTSLSSAPDNTGWGNN